MEAERELRAMRERLEREQEEDKRLQAPRESNNDFGRSSSDKGEKFSFQNEFALFSPLTDSQRAAAEERAAHFLGRPAREVLNTVMPSSAGPRYPPSSVPEMKADMDIKFPPNSSDTKFPSFPEMDLRFPGSSDRSRGHTPTSGGEELKYYSSPSSFPGGPPTASTRDIERDMREAYEGANGCETRADSPGSKPFVVQLPDSGPVFPTPHSQPSQLSGAL